MADDFQFSFPRYLTSKKTVDDRALNRVVMDTFRDELNAIGVDYPHILEIGAGIGSMIDRLVDWNIVKRGHYIALDSMEENIVEARRRILEWASRRKFQATVHDDGVIGIFSPAGVDLRVEFVNDDIFDYINSMADGQKFDALLSNAFLDLIDIKSQLPSIMGLLKPDGVYCFTINFDGATVFQPETDPELDARIERLYHQTMDDRITRGAKSGDSRAGRHLFNHLLSNGCSVLEVGASDWVVAPVQSGYRYDEEYFLRFIVETVGEALKTNPGVSSAELSEWLETRRGQIRRHELFYMAHQLDYVGRKIQVR